MKKADKDFQGIRGSLPHQLFKYIDMNDIAAQTQLFADYITRIATDFHARLVDTGHDHDLFLTEPIEMMAPKLFGQDVQMEYVGSGTVGTVYKMSIGDDIFALKINRMHGVKHEIQGIDIYKKARNLINRAHIGATFDFNGRTYSWVLMDYVADDYEMGFQDAKEKLFYAAMTKGLKYSDLYTPGNVLNAKIVDLAGVSVNAINLSRIEIDMVKKLIYYMRTDDMVGFVRLADMLIRRNPAVIKYMFVKMHLCQMEMPLRFQKFKKKIIEYNNQIRTPCQTITAKRSR